MHPVVESKRADLEALCAKFHVRRLELFGSAAKGGFDPARSDLDFLVEFGPLPKGSKARNYFGFLRALEGLFGRPVDVLTRRSVRNRYLLESIDSTRVLLHDAA